MFRGAFPRYFVGIALLTAAAGSGFATTFVVPGDAELIQKSDAIITGVVVSASTVEIEGSVETEYEIALSRVLKGPFGEGTFVRISSPGGTNDRRFTHVESSAHFAIGDDVLLFLTRFRGGWTPTDMTLGKFRSMVTSRGDRVAVRDAEDIHGWDRDGRVHKEKIRLESQFLRFIEDTVAGRTSETTDYEVEAEDVLATPSSALAAPRPVANLYPSPATTYSVSFHYCDGTRVPGRWETATMNAGLVFYKNSSQNASGLGDGGVSIIQNGLAAWTNDCESSVTISYGGTSQNLKNGDDGVNVVIFNDPGGDIAGTWTGSGIVAVTFSNGNVTHTYDGVEWVSMSDSDIIFQNGYAGTEASIEEAVTHELGHAIGLRHADKHSLTSCSVSGECTITCGAETACQTASEECASSGAAIMTAVVNASMGYTLQSWDQHGADALYPGTCVSLTPPTNVVATWLRTGVHVSWIEVPGAASYKVYKSANGTDFSVIGTPSVNTFDDTSITSEHAYLYKVRAVASGESDFSNQDLATTFSFTYAGAGDVITKARIEQLRSAIDIVRALTPLGPGSYTNVPLVAESTTILAVHINELRLALDDARTALSLPALSYAEAVAASGCIKASHITELQNGMD